MRRILTIATAAAALFLAAQVAFVGTASAASETATTYVNVNGNYVAGSCTYDDGSDLWVTGEGKADGVSVAETTTITCLLVVHFLSDSTDNYSTTAPGKYALTAGAKELLQTPTQICVSVTGRFLGTGTLVAPQHCTTI